MVKEDYNMYEYMKTLNIKGTCLCCASVLYFVLRSELNIPAIEFAYKRKRTHTRESFVGWFWESTSEQGTGVLKYIQPRGNRGNASH